MEYCDVKTFYLCSNEHLGGPRTRPLPPPQKVIDHDNAVKSIPQMADFASTEATSSAPEEQVFLSSDLVISLSHFVSPAI